VKGGRAGTPARSRSAYRDGFPGGPVTVAVSRRPCETGVAVRGPAYGLRQSSAAGSGELRSGKPLALFVLGRCGLENAEL
jgi:hypothetical protein